MYSPETFNLCTMPLSSKIKVLLSFISIETNDSVLVEKACVITNQLLKTIKITELDSIILKDILIWLHKILQENRNLMKIVLQTVKILIEFHFAADILDELQCYVKRILQLCTGLLLEKTTPESLESFKSLFEILTFLVNDDLLKSLDGKKLLKVNILETVGDIIIQINYSEKMHPEIQQSYMVPMFTVAILSKVSKEYTQYTENNFENFLGIISAYLFFNLNDHVKFPKKIVSHKSKYSSYEEVHTLKCQHSTRGKTSRIPKKRTLIKSSQSTKVMDNLNQNETTSTNDGEIYMFDSFIPRYFIECKDNFSIPSVKIRQGALSMLKFLTISLKKEMFYDYFHAFFPNNASIKEGLLYLVISDTNPQCRILALEIATQIIINAKVFLEQSEIPKKIPLSYIPHCYSLGQMLLVMYSNLNRALIAETSNAVLSNVLKCLAALVQATPFHKIHCDILGNLIAYIKQLLKHQDASVQISAFMVIECLISKPKVTKEISDNLGIRFHQIDKNEIQLYPEDQVSLESMPTECDEVYLGSFEAKTLLSSTKEVPISENWLIKIVLQILNQKNSETPSAVKIKSIQVLSSMSYHFSTLLYSLDEIEVTLNLSLNDSLIDMNLSASKCLDNIAYNMSNHLMCNKSSEVFRCQNFWVKMLPLVIEKIAEKNQLPAVKINLIDFLSNIGTIVFNQLHNFMQINLLSFLSGVGSDSEEHTAVRGAAVRALAIYSLFPSLKLDLVFIENTAELAVLLVSDQNLHVRIKSLWSIGNISDALVNNCEQVCDERISKKLLTRLITICLNTCHDNDKVRCNSVRALGNFALLISKDLLENINFRRLLEELMQKLVYCIKSAGSAKVKWNSCYAIGRAFQNNSLLFAASQCKDFNWIEPIFTTLCCAIEKHSNYKVRINATNAITHVSKKAFYFQYFKICWISLLNALEQSYDLINFLEYNHRDYFQERLCIALCHIIGVASNNDINDIKKEVEKRVDVIKTIWFRVLNRMTPEYAVPLLTCPISLQERLKLGTDLSEEQKKAINFLARIFSY